MLGVLNTFLCNLKKIILKMAFCVLYLCAPMECIGITEVSFGGLVRKEGTRLIQYRGYRGQLRMPCGEDTTDL